MAVKRKHIYVSLTIVVLIALNIWRWQPAIEMVPVSGERQAPTIKIEDFEVRAIADDVIPLLSRDIFHPKKNNSIRLRRKDSPPAVQLPPAKSPEELARDSAQAEFAQIRCVGVSVRKDHTQAYLNSAGEYLLVSQGDKVGGRFLVEKIAPDGVSLRDAVTGVGGLLTISGKQD